MKGIKKRRVLFSKIVRTIDSSTGETVEIMEHFTKEVQRDDFIKFYVTNTGMLLELKEHEIRLVLALLKYIGYNNTLFLTKETKVAVAKEIGKSAQRVSDTITGLVKKDILYRMSNGHYAVSPDIVFKGEELDRASLFKRLVEIKITDKKK